MTKKLKLFLLLGITFTFIIFGLINKRDQVEELLINNLNEVQESKNVEIKISAKKILELKESYPNSKEQLMEVILQKDEHQQQDHGPHSAEALIYNKKGAMKVLALRSLLKSEQNNTTKNKLLSEIIKKAKDPTIIKIAQATKLSLAKNRSFFKDFKSAVEDLPLPQ